MASSSCCHLLFLLLLTLLQLIGVWCEDCSSRNYEEPCQASNGDIQDGDGVLPQKHIIKSGGVAKRALISNNDLLWPDGIIYYTIDALFTDADKRTILEAMIDWENSTCIRFKENTNSSGYVHIRWSNIGCCSYIGRVGCRQGLSLHHSCFSKGTVSHELGHVMGMYHEQNRPDRDDHVIVVTQNIKLDALYNFNKLAPSVIDSLGIPYDYNSIMHYSPLAFAKTTSLYTMTSRTPNITLGPGQCPSRLDFVQIKKLYKCDNRNPSLSNIQLPPSPSFPPPITLPYPHCGHLYTSSFNFTRSYIHNTYCQWAIAVPHGFNLTLLVDINIESSGGCFKDYVRIQGSDGNWGQRYCSWNRITYQETRGEGVVMINYRTDSYNTYNGGFTGIRVEGIIADVDECSTGLDQCSHKCSNTNGSYVCSCPDGMYLSCDDRNCFDINECMDNNGGCRHQCTNIGRSYNCSCSNSDTSSCCLDDYTLYKNKCIVKGVDECREGSLNECSHFCTDNPLSYECSCKPGYTLSNEDQGTCIDINECVTYVKPEHHCSSCVNYDGDFLCLCGPGFMYGPDLHTCQDIDECTASLHNCSHICHNTDGSFTCACPNGWILSADNTSCTDINECLGNHGCQHSCLNTIGSYTCTCPNGLILNTTNNRTCKEGCFGSLHNCSHSCEKIEGSYICTCPNEWRLLSDKVTCISPCSPLVIELFNSTGSIQFNCSNSTWKIRVPDAKMVIKLTLVSMTLSCANTSGSGSGFIEVFNGYEPDQSISMVKACNVSAIDGPLISSVNEISIKYSPTRDNDTVTLLYETVPSTNDVVKSCVAIVSNGQRFSLSSFPNIYTQSVECSFYILSSRRPITITVLYTDLDYESCPLANRLSVHLTFDVSQDIGAVCNPRGETVFVIDAYFVLVRYVGVTTSKYRGFEALVTY